MQVPVDHSILKSMTVTSNGYNILDLSLQHRVVLAFVKWIGCPLCQNIVEDLTKLLPRFLKLNTLPVVCYQEDDKDAEKALKQMVSQQQEKQALAAFAAAQVAEKERIAKLNKQQTSPSKGNSLFHSLSKLINVNNNNKTPTTPQTPKISPATPSPSSSPSLGVSTPAQLYSQLEAELLNSSSNREWLMDELWRVKVTPQIHSAFQLDNWGLKKMFQHMPSLLHTMAVEKKSMVLPIASIQKNQQTKKLKAKQKKALQQQQLGLDASSSKKSEDSQSPVSDSEEDEEPEIENEPQSQASPMKPSTSFNKRNSISVLSDAFSFNTSVEIALFIVDKGTVIRSSIFEKKVKRITNESCISELEYTQISERCAKNIEELYSSVAHGKLDSLLQKALPQSVRKISNSIEALNFGATRLASDSVESTITTASADSSSIENHANVPRNRHSIAVGASSRLSPILTPSSPASIANTQSPSQILAKRKLSNGNNNNDNNSQDIQYELDKVLANYERRSLFKMFAKKHLCSESILFYESVMEYKSEATKYLKAVNKKQNTSNNEAIKQPIPIATIEAQARMVQDDDELITLHNNHKAASDVMMMGQCQELGSEQSVQRQARGDLSLNCVKKVTSDDDIDKELLAIVRSQLLQQQHASNKSKTKVLSSSDTATKLRNLCKDIVENFIVKGAAFEVNINHKVREELLQTMKQSSSGETQHEENNNTSSALGVMFNPSLFDKTLQDVKILSMVDVFMRFTREQQHLQKGGAMLW